MCLYGGLNTVTLPLMMNIDLIVWREGGKEKDKTGRSKENCTQIKDRCVRFATDNLTKYQFPMRYFALH